MWWVVGKAKIRQRNGPRSAGKELCRKGKACNCYGIALICIGKEKIGHGGERSRAVLAKVTVNDFLVTRLKNERKKKTWHWIFLRTRRWREE